MAEERDIRGWIDAFTEDGTFTDESIGVTYRGEYVGDPVVNYARAFPDMHRELHSFYTAGNIVIVQLALQGTHPAPLEMPFGRLRATGKRMDAPCCDIFELQHGKIKRFDCYPSGAVILTQLGVIANLAEALDRS
jgi:ketosteroid isomerase-like protein